MAATSTCICAQASSIDWSEHHLDHTQQKEEFLVEQYTQVLEALEDQYLRVKTLFTEIEEESFEGVALGSLLDSIGEAMRQNEVELTRTRRDLWKRYWEDGVIAGDVGEESSTQE